MKKITFLSLALALSAGTMFSETVQVTTTDMNVATAGSLPYVIANAPDGAETTIEFNFTGEQLDYADAGIPIGAKNLIIDGINKSNSKPVIIKGTTNLFNISSADAKVNMSNLIMTGCNAIVLKITGGSVNFDKCVFHDNIDILEPGKGNNGGVMRISGGNITIKNSLFYKNKGLGGYGGGAICVYDNVKLRVENCTFTENEGYSGGAIGVNVRAKKGFIPTVYIANSTFANNITADRGGALYMQTAETTGVFKPVIVNCTFVGQLNGKDGGAVLFWSRNTTSMKPVLINNLFAANHIDPWDKNSAQDAHAFYLEGALDINGKPLPQTVFPITKNNLYIAAQDKFFATANGDKVVEFANLFKEIEKNPLDEGDDFFNHQSSKLSGDLRVAMIAENSPAVGAGVASYDTYEIPTTDQLGKNRPSTPSVGAVEYGTTGISDNIVNDSNAKIWNVGNELHFSGIEGNNSVEVFDLAGKMVFNGNIECDSSITINNVTNGVYIVKVANAVAKVIF
ncbi:MAG: T9SS type A sorting domain-containing protein [Muribaculaceae bacterium]